jgi:ABC-type sulfate transport system permease subunit
MDAETIFRAASLLAALAIAVLALRNTEAWRRRQSRREDPPENPE